MRKLLLSIVTLFAAVSSQAAIDDDLTGKYLQNADFSQGDVIDSGICTYDKDMETNETKYFGQQEVAGWTAFSLSTNTYEAPGLGDASPNRAASAIYAFNDEASEDDDVIFLGGKGFLAPFMNSADEEAGRFLGLVAVWGGTAQYTQTVTLPAGCYTLTFKTYNGAGTGAVSSNLFGFIADGGKAYTCATTAFGEVGTWFDQEVTFILDQETSGVISVGYQGPAGSGAMPHLFIESVKLTEGDPQVILGPMIDAAKDELLVLLEDGDELGVDTRAGWAVYNDDNATLEQVNEAIANQKATNEKGMTDFTDYFINNAHFSQGTPLDAGVCTYDYDMPGNSTKYFGMQPIEKWTASSPSDNVQLMENSGSTPANPLNSRASGLFAVGSADSIWLGSKGDLAPTTKANGSTEGNVFGFISVWTGTAYYSQHVTLPAGSYTITIPTYNERGTGAISKNMCGFIADNGMEYLAETKTFTVGKWENETIKFTLDEDTPGIITIGYVAANAGSGSMPHLFVDEFLLKYNGTIEESPSLIALRGAVSSAEEFEAICEASIKDSLEKAIEAGAELVSANSKDDDANIKAATAINNLMIEANASAAVYAKFIAFIEGEMANTYEKYKDGELSEFANELTELIDTYTGAYEDGEYTTEQINEAMSSFKAQVVAAVKEALTTAAADGKEHSLDVSALFTNIDYAKSTVEGWQNETGTTAFLSRVQTAEVWNQSNFNVYQTLAEMPAGAYEISVNGFYRSAANVDNYAEWQDEDVVGQAYLYAGGNKVLMHNVAEYAAEKDDNHTAAADAASEEEGATLFVPNSNANANYIFYTDGEAVNKVTTALLEEGDLTIGIKGENLEGNAWVVWGGFTVTYKGVSDELIKAAVNNEIEGLIEQATAMLDDEYVAAVDKNDVQIHEAVEGGEDAIKSESIEEKSAAIASLKEAMEYASKSEALLQKLVSLVDAYTTIVENAELDYTKEPLQDMLEEIGDPVEDGVPSNEKVQEWIDAIPGAWIAQVCATVGLDKATEAAPVEITPAIINAGFEGADGATPGASYWSVTKDGGNEGYQFGIYEFYDNNSCDIHQTIEGLIPGYYRVMVQGFYRAGGNEANVASMTETPDSINHAQLYANDRAVNLKNVLDLEDVEDEDYVAGAGLGVGSEPVVTWKENEEFHVPNNREALAAYFELGLYSNQIDCQVTEDGKLTLGIKKEAHVGTDWLPYDNFQLFYLGTAQPTAVEGVAAEAQAAKAIYDLQGRKVSKAQKGLYIMNGKVVIVK